MPLVFILALVASAQAPSPEAQCQAIKEALLKPADPDALDLASIHLASDKPLWERNPDGSGYACDAEEKLGTRAFNHLETRVSFLASGADRIEGIDFGVLLADPSVKREAMHRLKASVVAAIRAVGAEPPPHIDALFSRGRLFRIQLGTWAFAVRHWPAKGTKVESYDVILTSTSKAEDLK